jgi:hypothetical protein
LCHAGTEKPYWGCVEAWFIGTITNMRQIIYAAVVGFVAVQLYQAARSTLMQKAWTMARGIKIRHFFANLPMLASTMVVAAIFLFIPGLSWGWWSMFGGEGSILLGRVQDGEESRAIVSMISAFLMSAFIVVVPPLAMREEQIFRMGSERRAPKDRITNAVFFGLLHSVMGIPIGVALALSLGGIWFTSRYLSGYKKARIAGQGLVESQEAGIRESTLYHMAWNWTVLALVISLMLF